MSKYHVTPWLMQNHAQQWRYISAFSTKTLGYNRKHKNKTRVLRFTVITYMIHDNLCTYGHWINENPHLNIRRTTVLEHFSLWKEVAGRDVICQNCTCVWYFYWLEGRVTTCTQSRLYFQSWCRICIHINGFSRKQNTVWIRTNVSVYVIIDHKILSTFKT